MLKLIVFDCDGVMFDSRRANQEYYNQLLSHFNHKEMDEAELEYAHMHDVASSIQHIFRHYHDDDLEEVSQYRKKLGYAPFLPLMKMEDDLVEFLEYAKKKFYLAISTNRTNTIQPLLQTFNLQDYFGKVMTAENAGRPKPAPDALAEILRHFNCSPAETIYIGDSIIDRQHTAHFNIPLIAFKSPDIPAEYYVSSFMEILKLPPFQEKL
jgi:HAD superfamily hydrolase (TIGR01549 family)